MSANPEDHLAGNRRYVLRLLLSAVLVGLVTTGLLWRVTSPSDSVDTPTQLPKSAAALAVFLKEKIPPARIVSTRTDGQIDRSFFLTVRETDENTLRSLPRAAERAEEWRGVVLCEWLVNQEQAGLSAEQWGEHGLELPPFVFFGDKELLRKIKDAFRSPHLPLYGIAVQSLCVQLYRNQALYPSRFGRFAARWKMAKKKRGLGVEILQGIREIKRGEHGRVINIPDVAATRAKIGLSQARFAELLGVSVRTLQEWEQGRRAPSGAARTLLMIAAKNPLALLEGA